MSTIQEIRTAIARLPERDQAVLKAELFAFDDEPENEALEAALERGLQDATAGRVRPIEDARALVRKWTTKS